jgi:hypothetical protein
VWKRAAIVVLVLSCSAPAPAGGEVFVHWTCGDRVSADLGRGLEIVLEPHTPCGFSFDVRGDGEGFAFVTPPYHGPNALDVSAEDFGDGPLIGPDRTITFVTIHDEASRAVRVIDSVLRGDADPSALDALHVAHAEVHLTHPVVRDEKLASVDVAVSVRD